MSTRKVEEFEEVPADFGVTVLRRLPPSEIEEITFQTASMTKFRKLALVSGLLLHVQGTEVRVAATFYASKSKDHNVGDKKADEYNRRVVSLTMLSPEVGSEFGAQAVWYEKLVTKKGNPVWEFVFDNARVGGPRSGHRRAAFYTQPTAMNLEIARCLAA
jgi:hypothetical protein